MSLKPKSEMNRLLWAFTIPVLLLVAIIVGFYLVDGIVSANNNAKHTKQILVEQTFKTYNRIGENFRNLNFGPEVAKTFSQEIVQSISSGQLAPLYEGIKTIEKLTSTASYMAVIENGKVVNAMELPGVTVDPNQVPKNPLKGEYEIVDSFGSLKGTIMLTFYTVDLSKFGLKGKFDLVTAFDLTKQIQAIDKYFNDQKRDTIIKLTITAIVALVLFALLTIFWLRYLINRYIRRPVDKLNTTAKELAAGTFLGEVEVDPDSDFAALQGLLQSGQLVLRRLDEKMED